MLALRVRSCIGGWAQRVKELWLWVIKVTRAAIGEVGVWGQEEDFDLLARCEDLCYKGIIMGRTHHCQGRNLQFNDSTLALVTNDERSKTRIGDGVGRDVNDEYLVFGGVYLVFWSEEYKKGRGGSQQCTLWFQFSPSHLFFTCCHQNHPASDHHIYDHHVQSVSFNWASPKFAKCWPVSNWFKKNVRVPDWPPLMIGKRLSVWRSEYDSNT